jgi:hypothetical protein
VIGYTVLEPSILTLPVRLVPFEASDFGLPQAASAETTKERRINLKFMKGVLG